MKTIKLSATMLLVLLLTACGGSSDNNEADTLDINTGAILANGGSLLAEQPSLAGGDTIYTDGYYVSIDQKYVINSKYPEIDLAFRPKEDGFVIIQFTSDTQQEELSLGAGSSLKEWNEEWSENSRTISLIVAAEELKTIYLELEGDNGSKLSGELIITKLNKETLGLTSNEILVYTENKQTKNSCDPGDLDSPEYNFDIYNFKQQYVRELNDNSRDTCSGLIQMDTSMRDNRPRLA